jgi:hypothetical protein
MDTNDIQYSWQYSPEQKSVLRPKLARGERSVGGGLWFVTLLPLIGMFMENFAVDKYSGAVLWLMVIGFMFFGCHADLRHAYDLDEQAKQQLSKAVMIPPVYLYRRDKLRGVGGTKGIVMAILIAAAFFSNGFVQGLTVNKDSISERLENTYVETLGFETEDDEKTVGAQIKAWFDNGVYKSECTHSGDIYAVTYIGTHDSKPAEVTVNVEHDGFVFKDITAEGIKFDGKELEDDELEDMQEEIFLGDEADEDDSEESSEEE